MYSVGDEVGVQALIGMARSLSRTNDKTYIAAKLSLDSLEAFSENLDRCHDVLVQRGLCRFPRKKRCRK